MEQAKIERKCPRCGVTAKRDYPDRCLDKACPPFESWPKVIDER